LLAANGTRQPNNGTASVGDNAFANCDSLTVVYLPHTIAHIGESAFSDCPNLTMVSIPGDIIDISPAAFSSSRNVALQVDQGSFAEAYALKHGLPYIYTPD